MSSLGTAMAHPSLFHSAESVAESALPHLLPVARDCMAPSYPEVANDFQRISEYAYGEEEAFLATLGKGTTILDTAIIQTKSAYPRRSASASWTDGEEIHPATFPELSPLTMTAAPTAVQIRKSHQTIVEITPSGTGPCNGSEDSSSAGSTAANVGHNRWTSGKFVAHARWRTTSLASDCEFALDSLGDHFPA